MKDKDGHLEMNFKVLDSRVDKFSRLSPDILIKK